MRLGRESEDEFEEVGLVVREALLSFKALPSHPRAVRARHVAMRLAAQRKPDIVVSDVLMPPMAAFGVCKTLRATPGMSDVPIVLV